MKKIVFNGYITSIRSRKDKSLGFSGETPELSVEEMLEFMRLQGINLDITLEPLDIKADGVVTVDKEAGLKSPSERLRATIWRVWEQNDSKGNFNVFYAEQMENLIEYYKNKLV